MSEQSKMELEYEECRGYGVGCCPDVLLDEKKDTYYESEYRLPIHEDWIEFENKNSAFVPKYVMIRNSAGPSAIKSIVVSYSVGVHECPNKLVEIKDIKQGDEERQWFAVKEQTAKASYNRNHCIRIDILENYGYQQYNRFKEFSIYGVSG